MNNLPKISIVMPSYNAAEYIEKSVLSAINQIYSNVEIIIIDDASNDNTISILNDINKRYNNCLIIYKLPINLGPSNARNLGIKKCSGEYIAFLDSDDVWYSEKLQKQYEQLKDNKFNLCFSDIDILENEIVTHTRKHFYECYNYSELLKRNFIPLSTLLLKKSLLEKVKYRDIQNSSKIVKLIVQKFKINRLIHEDYAFLLELFRTQKIKASYIPEPLLAYRLHENNYSKNYLKKVLSLYTIYRVNEKNTIMFSLFYVIRISILATLKNIR